jgi:hypothetical protein
VKSSKAVLKGRGFKPNFFMKINKVLKSRSLRPPVEIGTVNDRKLFAMSVESPASGWEQYGNSIYVSYNSIGLDPVLYDSLLKMTQIMSSDLNYPEIDKLRQMKI